MRKSVRLWPSWLSPSATAPGLAAADIDSYPPRADFQPLEECLPELLDKEEDGCQRSPLLPYPPLWSLAGVGGEGDRPGDKLPFSAFFADKPPAAPLWLVAKEAHQPSASASASIRLFAKTSDPTQEILEHRARSAKTASFNQKSVRSSSYRRALLRSRELLTPPVLVSAGREPAPPVHPPCPWPRLLNSQTSVCTHNTITTYTMSGPAAQELKATCDYPTAGAGVGVGKPLDDCRSIAVQAETPDDSKAYCMESHRNSGSSRCDGWLGGVRALRDSHMRLLVRQLRHIELLNHAIDAAGAGAGSHDDDNTDIEV